MRSPPPPGRSHHTPPPPGRRRHTLPQRGGCSRHAADPVLAAGSGPLHPSSRSNPMARDEVGALGQRMDKLLSFTIHS
ncbi:hypothetical protein VPH35_052106 [Triticum aestivum]